jgi:hypothetical protein
MGRKIRKVPPNWDHPRKRFAWGIDFVSMWDRSFDEANAEWATDRDRVARGEMDEFEASCYKNVAEWLEDHPAPNSNDTVLWRPYSKEEATWFQLWQTVSEGSPVTPPFATIEELADYLATNGDFWDQSRRPGRSGWGKETADAFCKVGWAPTFVVTDGNGIEGKFAP